MKVFSIIFGIFGLIAFACGLTGATHQFYTAGLCTMLAIVLYTERKEASHDRR